MLMAVCVGGYNEDPPRNPARLLGVRVVSRMRRVVSGS